VWSRRRWAVGSALAVAALGGLAILAPWPRESERPLSPVPAVTSAPPAAGTPAEALPSQVLVQSVETGDPGSSVMIFSPADSDFDVLWVFGLQRTEA
jgi:hypothetical protein